VRSAVHSSTLILAHFSSDKAFQVGVPNTGSTCDVMLFRSTPHRSAAPAKLLRKDIW
jgi:hypothetical protein